MNSTASTVSSLLRATVPLLAVISASSLHGTLVSIDDLTGANSASITMTPPNPVTEDPNNGILLAWNEIQNSTLTSDLKVDRVFDPNASFVQAVSGGFVLKSGTIVSSHYFQWDPGNGSGTRVTATIKLDAQVFAVLTADQNLFDSDFLGLPGINYNDFGLRGIESGDTTAFNGSDLDISWRAGSPGDWVRVLSAYSPIAAIPEPSAITSLLAGFVGLFALLLRRRS